MSAFLGQTNRKSRKQRWCDECRTEIEIGEIYTRIASVQDGDFYASTCHPECFEDAMRVCEADCDGRSFLSEEIDDSGEPLDTFDLSPIVRSRIEKLYARRAEVRAQRLAAISKRTGT